MDNLVWATAPLPSGDILLDVYRDARREVWVESLDSYLWSVPTSS
jgi:hypothetical protein